MMGEAPKFADGNVPSLNDWPSQDEAFHRVSEAIADGFQVASANAAQKSAERCLLVVEESLKPAWEITIEIDQLIYRGWADHHQSYGAEPRFFSASGTASVYVENPRTGSIKDVSLTGLDEGTQELKSAYFETYPVGKTKASSSSRTYSYTTSQIQFDETSVFTHASRQMDVFNSLRKDLTGKAYDFAGDRILIVVHAQPGGTPNNALYQPKSSSSYGQPTIMIGDGDGSILQNLSWDSDVVAHELGHHIVFEYLKSISGQSLTLHEALADFFTFSRSGDACLAESICPDGSPSYVNRGACWTAKECLRSGETNIKATDKVIPDTSISIKDGHIRGQVVSGNLWDLRKSGKIPAADLTKLVFKAVTYLRDSSGFRDLQLALFLADQELFAKKYASALYDAAVARGFEAYITDVKVTSGSYPEVGSTGPSDSLSSASSSSSSDDSPKKKVLGICGVGTGVAGVLGGWLTLLPLLLLPILVHIRCPARVPVRNPRTNGKQRPQAKA